MPDYGGTFRSVRQLPPNVARELLLTGEFLSAERAERLGFVNRITEPGRRARRSARARRAGLRQRTTCGSVGARQRERGARGRRGHLLGDERPSAPRSRRHRGLHGRHRRVLRTPSSGVEEPVAVSVGQHRLRLDRAAHELAVVTRDVGLHDDRAAPDVNGNRDACDRPARAAPQEVRLRFDGGRCRPFGRLSVAHIAPTESANAMRKPPCSVSPAVQRSGFHSAWLRRGRGRRP